MLLETYFVTMKVARLHRIFSDATRLRILQVLQAGPLCVCHFQAVLREPQAKVSKHLAILRAAGVVEAQRTGQWMCYALPDKPDVATAALLSGLAACVTVEIAFRKDAERLAKIDLGCTPAASARDFC
jgi:ArsR family transcriptional regulator, arsenate/arsenite/antimonite-responsive transcriptional repressor